LIIIRSAVPSTTSAIRLLRTFLAFVAFVTYFLAYFWRAVRWIETPRLNLKRILLQLRSVSRCLKVSHTTCLAFLDYAH